MQNKQIPIYNIFSTYCVSGTGWNALHFLCHLTSPKNLYGRNSGYLNFIEEEIAV